MMCVAVRQDIAFGVYPSARASFVLSRHASGNCGFRTLSRACQMALLAVQRSPRPSASPARDGQQRVDSGNSLRPTHAKEAIMGCDTDSSGTSRRLTTTT
jgi:hypothetical protein